MNKVDLSIIILSYNTKKLTLETIASLEENYPEEMASGSYEVIVVDNASSDGSAEALKEYKSKTNIESFHIVANHTNIGFGAGNNKGLSHVKGNYVLFLNPDTVVHPKTLIYMLHFMNEHPEAGAATCKLELPSGGMDEACHRGFPTPWNAFCHFSGLEKMFPKSRLFSGYLQGWKDLRNIHEVDAVAGAFLLVRREIGEKIGWWDEDYFFYGEDLQFCYDIGKIGSKIYYVPDVSILHYGGVTSGIKKTSQDITTADNERRRRVQGYRFDAMRIFYKKNYANRYPKFVSWLVFQGINFLNHENLAKLKSV